MILNDQWLEQQTKFKRTPKQEAFEKKWKRNLTIFEPASLPQVANVNLMRRMDTKFVFPITLLPSLLDNLQPSYRILEVDGVRLQQYQTLYFDTPDFRFYRQHHNGQRDRFKLRVRSYLNSELDYLEVKRKDNHNFTQKSRLKAELPITGYAPEIKSFLDTTLPYNKATLVPKITNQFYRISLLSKFDWERLTLDLHLRFLSPSGEFSLPGIVIAEVKQPHFSVHSTFMHQMRRAGYRSTRFSKYCVGVALAYPHLKRNAFKPLLRNIQKLVLGGSP
jgi:hypothetical protein